jgi:hypothetical protein
MVVGPADVGTGVAVTTTGEEMAVAVTTTGVALAAAVEVAVAGATD